MAKSDFQLAHPPRNRTRGEAPAIIEPALRDMPEFTGFDVTDIESFEGELDKLDDRFFELAREVAFDDERVRKLIGGQRYSFIGVSRRDDEKDDDAVRAVAIAYLYDDARALEVHLGGDEDKLHVVDASQQDYQPPPSDEEIERAIELAQRWPGLGERLEVGDEPVAILVSDVELGDHHHGTRRIFVGFGPADERLPRVSSIVDLGSERVVEIDGRSIGSDEEAAS